MITREHIRLAQAGQLARLFETSRGVVSNWTHGRRFAERQLDTAVIKGISKEVLVAGIEARRKDAEKTRQHWLELEQFLSDLEANRHNKTASKQTVR